MPDAEARSPAVERQPGPAAAVVLAAALAAAASGCAWSPQSSDQGGRRAPATSTGRAQREPRPAATRQAADAASTAGVRDDGIVFGQSAVLSGGAREVGRNMRQGILAAFDEANRAGGIDGRRLELITLDDAYEPEAAIVNTRALIEEHEAFALIGSTGTPTTRSAAPIAAAAEVPYIAPVTGAAFLHEPGWTNVLNVRSSYEQEAEAIVSRLLTELPTERIGVLYQDDSFGRTGYRGVRLALERRGLAPVAIGVYARNTSAVKTALLDLRNGDPEAVILIATAEPIVALLEWAAQLGMEPVFATLSIVGRAVLSEPAARGLYVSQVVPEPTGDDRPLTRRYRRALREHDPRSRPGFVSLEGYVAGRVAIAGARRCSPAITRACFMERLRARPVDVDGFEVSFGADRGEESASVHLTRISAAGTFEPAARIERPAGRREPAR